MTKLIDDASDPGTDSAISTAAPDPILLGLAEKARNKTPQELLAERRERETECRQRDEAWHRRNRRRRIGLAAFIALCALGVFAVPNGIGPRTYFGAVLLFALTYLACRWQLPRLATIPLITLIPIAVAFGSFNLVFFFFQVPVLCLISLVVAFASEWTSAEN